MKITNIKFCTKCGHGLPLRQFYKDKSTKDGYRYWCKECVKEYRKTYRIKDAETRRNYRKTIMGCLHTRFQHMKYRCNNPKCSDYKNYGGRGIKVKFISVDEFTNYVINKLQIDPRGLDIDRIDNDGDYEPQNIQFITRSENLKNKRKHHRRQK